MFDNPVAAFDSPVGCPGVEVVEELVLPLADRRREAHQLRHGMVRDVRVPPHQLALPVSPVHARVVQLGQVLLGRSGPHQRLVEFPARARATTRCREAIGVAGRERSTASEAREYLGVVGNCVGGDPRRCSPCVGRLRVRRCY